MAFLKIEMEDAQKIANYMSQRPWREAHPFMMMIGNLQPIEEKAEGKSGDQAKADEKSAAVKPTIRAVKSVSEAPTTEKAVVGNGADHIAETVGVAPEIK